MGERYAGSTCTCRPSHGDKAKGPALCMRRRRVGVKMPGPALSHGFCLEVLVPTLLQVVGVECSYNRFDKSVVLKHHGILYVG
jgi:hypothetical protein